MHQYKCVYCAAWSHSAIIKRDSESKSKTIKRKCAVTGATIAIETESCKYFCPAVCFRCIANNHDITFLACLNRRYNPEKLNAFEKCRRCRQFDIDIKSIIKDFWIRANKVLQPPTNQESKKIIKRREATRTIKRRTQPPKRVIKRREKKIKRRIRRR